MDDILCPCAQMNTKKCVHKNIYRPVEQGEVKIMLLTLYVDLVMKRKVVAVRICRSSVENSIYPFQSCSVQD
jgi:hypothetical protein